MRVYQSSKFTLKATEYLHQGSSEFYRFLFGLNCTLLLLVTTHLYSDENTTCLK